MQSPMRALLYGMAIWSVWASLVVVSAQLVPREREGWYRHLLAWAIGSAPLLGMVFLVGDPARTESLSARAAARTLILAIDFVWSFRFTFWPRKAKKS